MLINVNKTKLVLLKYLKFNKMCVYANFSSSCTGSRKF